MESISYAVLSAPLLKKVFIASTEKGVFHVDFHTSEKRFVEELKKRSRGKIVRNQRGNPEALAQMKRYLQGRLRKFDCPLDLRGTPFQKEVWSALMKIPYGQTRSYQDVARSIGRARACRAVGNANGANAIPLIVPCHRVIENHGGMGGFGHGIVLKKRLLDFEKAHAT